MLKRKISIQCLESYEEAGERQHAVTHALQKKKHSRHSLPRIVVFVH